MSYHLNTACALHAQKGGCTDWGRAPRNLRSLSSLHLYTDFCRRSSLVSTSLKPCCTSVLSYVKLSKLFRRLCQPVAQFEHMKYNWRLGSLHIATTGKGELIKSLANSPHPTSTLPFLVAWLLAKSCRAASAKASSQLLGNVGNIIQWLDDYISRHIRNRI